MRYQEIIAEAEAPSFKLAPGLDPQNYEISETFADVDRWKAMTYSGDSTIPRGTLGKVGYVWISLKDNTIIPISRGDEHHEGAVMVHDLIRKKKLSINPSEYMPFWSLGNNYIYYRNTVPKWIAVIQKFLAWGGKNGVMKGSNDERGLLLDYRQFIEYEGTITLTQGKLNPLGQRFYDLHKALQDAILAAHGSDKASIVGKPFKLAADLVKFISELTFHAPADGLGPDKMKAFVKSLREVTKARDIQALSELMFGFNSPKRAFHEKIRHTGPKDWAYSDLKAFWGDIEYAENLLAHI
jgi:hypothetical protein